MGDRQIYKNYNIKICIIVFVILILNSIIVYSSSEHSITTFDGCYSYYKVRINSLYESYSLKRCTKEDSNITIWDCPCNSAKNEIILVANDYTNELFSFKIEYIIPQFSSEQNTNLSFTEIDAKGFLRQINLPNINLKGEEIKPEPVVVIQPNITLFIIIIFIVVVLISILVIVLYRVFVQERDDSRIDKHNSTNDYNNILDKIKLK